MSLEMAILRLETVEQLLRRCDRVKFAGEVPGPEACREAIDDAYRIVDATRPRPARQDRTARGAA